MKYLLKGDCHGNFVWLDNLSYPPEDTAIILLGDCGFNFFLTKLDQKLKKVVNSKGFRLYCLRGNHEARPEDIPTMEKIYDEDISGVVYWEPEYPNIRYLLDYGEYKFGKYFAAVIGGAYSVDKWYRLERAGIKDEANNNPKRTGWFANEQLSAEEISYAGFLFSDSFYDFVFTHTCPISFQPTDLFLGFVDQSKVDNTMEIAMEQIKDKFDWRIWCFGHYHADRIERPYVEQYFHDVEELDVIWERWQRYAQTGELDWWLTKSPNFYMGVQT